MSCLQFLYSNTGTPRLRSFLIVYRTTSDWSIGAPILLILSADTLANGVPVWPLALGMASFTPPRTPSGSFTLTSKPPFAYQNPYHTHTQHDSCSTLKVKAGRPKSPQS